MPTFYNKLTVVDGNSTIREIDLSQDTVSSAADIMSGKYGHLNTGERVLGTGQGVGTLVQKTITLNGTYDPDDDSADGYSEVTVNVQGGASMTEVANTYGTELVITSAPGSAPSATRHTLYFEYTDSTNDTVYAYYDDPLIGPAITATTPTTHNNKTVTLAQLDGVTWYSYSPSSGIPLNTELIDSTAVVANTAIDSNGDAIEMEWYYTSDYTAVEPGMTFSYLCAKWFSIGVYDSSHNVLNVISAQSDGTPDAENENLVSGTLSGSELPSGTAYVRLTSFERTSEWMSLIRTA